MGGKKPQELIKEKVISILNNQRYKEREQFINLEVEEGFQQCGSVRKGPEITGRSVSGDHENRLVIVFKV